MGVGVFVEKRERKQKHSISLYAVDINKTYNDICDYKHNEYIAPWVK